MTIDEPETTKSKSYAGLLGSIWIGSIGFLVMVATLTVPVFASPTALFSIVFVAASLCVVAAIASQVVARRDNLAELGLMSGFTFALSLLPLVHGITTPGVFYGPNAATMSSVLWSTPIAAIAVVPLIQPRSFLSRRLLAHWRPFIGTYTVAVCVLAVGLLFKPSLLPTFAMGSQKALLVGAVSMGIALLLSIRHLRLAQIAQSGGPFGVAIGFVSVGLSNMVWLSPVPFTPLFWLAHVLDIAGVFVLTLLAMYTYSQQPNIRSLIGPFVAQTPLAALELGLEPLVHHFVASLERKDEVTRQHVVRTTDLAMGVGVSFGLRPEELHVLGLGAMLHDIGKLAIDSAILQKPSGLTVEEFSVMKRHTEFGEALVSAAPSLRLIAPIVRGHHERVDGRGYPDGLAGEDIPLLTRIVSVCDAYDAMANTRQYRKGMEQEKVFAILREHSGSQWDGRVVEVLIAHVRDTPINERTLDQVGRDALSTSAEFHDELCGCLDAAIESALQELSVEHVRVAGPIDEVAV